MYATAEDMRAAAWTAMGRGVADRRHPARHPTLATTGVDGPTARTVVLRGWDDRQAEFHTDTASAKIRDLKADPRAALHVWIPKQMLQIRLTGLVSQTIGDGDAWARVPETAQRVYGGTPPPGAPMASDREHDPSPDPARFCVLRLSVHRADLLLLGSERHQRVVATRSGDGWQSGWVAP